MSESDFKKKKDSTSGKWEEIWAFQQIGGITGKSFGEIKESCPFPT